VTADGIARIRSALAVRGRDTSDFDLNPHALPAGRSGFRQAGVLVPLQASEFGLRVVLTKRSPVLRHHPGQVAFPGGKIEKDDRGAVEAAQREAHEEIGLKPGNVEIIGLLPCHETVTSFRITPVIGRIIGDFQPSPRRGEVEEVFTVPFSHIADPVSYSVQSGNWRGQKRYYYTVPYGPYYIWGATARILRALAERIST